MRILTRLGVLKALAAASVLLAISFLGHPAYAACQDQSAIPGMLYGNNGSTSACTDAYIDPTTHALIVSGGGGTPSAPSYEKPAPRTIVALDVATVTTGGTAVTALTAGHRSAGGFLLNPKAATIDLCINEQGTASGTTSAGALTCIVPGQSYNITPAAGAVSVVTSDNAHPFSGYGLN